MHGKKQHNFCHRVLLNSVGRILISKLMLLESVVTEGFMREVGSGLHITLGL